MEINVFSKLKLTMSMQHDCKYLLATACPQLAELMRRPLSHQFCDVKAMMNTLMTRGNMFSSAVEVNRATLAVEAESLLR